MKFMSLNSLFRYLKIQPAHLKLSSCNDLNQYNNAKALSCKGIGNIQFVSIPGRWSKGAKRIVEAISQTNGTI
jgi:hypothetical protein